ncbi:translational activator of cytochrome c oxidase 1 [Alligator mississippiensis]|uniref:translational activator of cytochrome c oxidase 1 n=1 Tax=Alligator mississippiensis TaxID=8496 RepID=UPI0006EC538C|nr:translational activator of cytochrome c oxidase 1 [Alligator mississippiensis]XP_059584441.1 translational activator of cytochrome c oxidase 1 [Alligator mississippiensis]
MATSATLQRATVRYQRLLLASALASKGSAPCLSALGPPYLLGRALRITGAIPAGHNKWSKVKNIKGPRDAKRSQIFQKLSMMLRFAVREGGPDPELNSNLANIIEQCRNNNMPKASIEMAIKGVDKEKSTTYVLYTARGPGGSALVIEILTDNTRRTQQEIRLLLSRNGAVITDGVRHLFDQKGVVTVSRKDQEQRSVSLEQALELAVEAGAEDVQESEDEEEQEVLKFLCDVSVLHQVRKKLDAQGLQSLSAGLEFIPNTTVELSEEEMKQASELLMVLGNCQDVIRIYDNIQ